MSVRQTYENMVAFSFGLLDNLHREYTNQIFKIMEEEKNEKDTVSYETRTNII